MASVRITREAVTLRFGEPDTPAPEGIVSASPPPRIVVAVSPVDSRIRVNVMLQSTGGQRPFTLRAGRRTREEQFFEGAFPDLHGGDRVEYSVRAEMERQGAVLRLDSSEIVDGGLRKFEVTGGGLSHLTERAAPTTGRKTTSPKLTTSTVDRASISSKASVPPAVSSTETKPKEGEFVVRGHVVYRDGPLIEGVTVRAYNKDLGHEDYLGEAVTGKEGRYEIKYSAAQFSRSGKKYADLVLRVYDLRDTPGRSKEEINKPLVESAIVFGAQPLEKVKLWVEGGPEHTWSEYEQIMTELPPLLRDRTITSLGEDEKNQDITFLAGQAEIEPRWLAYIVVAHRLAAQSGLPPEIFYGFLRQNLPTNLPELLAQGNMAQRKALEVAIAQHIIPGAWLGKLDQVLDQLQQLIVQHAFEPPKEEGRTSFGALLATTLKDARAQEQFVKQYVNRTQPVEAFWKSLAEQPDFKDQVGSLQTTLQLGALTSNHLPLIQRLQSMKQAGQFQNLRDLARLDVNGWKQIIVGQGEAGAVTFPPEIKGKDGDEKAVNYAKTLETIVQDAFPTVAAAYRVQKDEIGASADLRAFYKNIIDQEADFDLGQTTIDTFLKANPSVLKGVADSQALSSELKSHQRMFRLMPQYEQYSSLVKQKVDSALAITRMGETRFLANHSAAIGSLAIAKVKYNQSSYVAATALNLFANLSVAFNGTGMQVLPFKPPQVEGVPEWETLFGSLDLCACEHCRSVYSPAAYLVDVLAFLKERKAKAGNTVSDVLFERRPDIGDIELTCENTNTPLPYVDLVNEILENAIAPFTPFVLTAGMESHLNNTVFPDELRAEFAAHDVFLRNVDVTVVNAGSGWLVTDRSVLYRIQKNSGTGQLEVVAASYQTSGSAQELSANPEHVNRAAYQTLRQEIFPWSLPLDLWTEETRTFLGHLGVERHELMQTFRRDAPSPDPTEPEITREALNLTAAEQQIITGAQLNPPRKAWELWGLEETGNPVDAPDPANPSHTINVGADWRRAIGFVRVFLNRTGLAYEEMADLLKTRFVDPEGNLSVVSNDPTDPTSCDTARLEIVFQATPESAPTDIPEPFLTRMYRFVRLWRRMGWTMMELDKAITTLNPPVLDDGFLQELTNIRKLQAGLSVPLPTVLSWYGPIDTAQCPGYGSTPKKKSLYEELFQNPAIIKLVPGETDPFALDESGTEVTVATSLGDKKIAAALLGALAINESDLSDLINGNAGFPSSVTSGKQLNLENLSRLYRHVSFARALSLSVPDFLRLKAITGMEPLVNDSQAATPAQTIETLRFVKIVDSVRASGFSTDELDYLLRHRFSESSGVAPTMEDAALVLDEIRIGLQKINDETAIVSDLTGDITRKKLALLRWSAPLIEQAVAILNGSAVFAASLPAMPSGIVIPDDLKSKVGYDDSAKKLQLSGLMTPVQKGALLDASTDSAFQGAVSQLSDLPRSFITQKMKAFEFPVFAANLAALPAAVSFPSSLRNRIYYDNVAKELRFAGIMLESEKGDLLKTSSDGPYQAAINALFTAPETYAPPAANQFLTAQDVTNLFDSDPFTNAEQRFGIVLARLMPYLKSSLSTNLVKQKLGEALALEAKTVEQLVAQQIQSPVNAGQKAIGDFLAPSFAESNTTVVLTADVFKAPFTTFTLLHKCAMVVHKFKLTPKQLWWLSQYGPDSGWLNLNALPLSESGPPAEFESWARLADLVQLRGKLPAGEATLSDILALASDPSTTLDGLLKRLSERAGWNKDDLATLTGRLQIKYGSQWLSLSIPSTYLHEEALLRLKACFVMMKRLGASADRCIDWSKADLTAEDARSARQTVKSKYEDEQWLAVAKPLRDVLREKQRAALVAYLVAHPTAEKGQNWRDTNGLYEYFLIDVEMAPCMMTSRIKQAISSVQLFVQRCLMNLEYSKVAANAKEDVHWRDWKWMKNYRVWEANRKVFLYPENWIEPELRDDKSPFFKDLENELLQQDVTSESAEDALRNYLEKLDEVARLEIVGMYHQVENDGVGQPAIDILHVFGRTSGNSPHYFYRQRISSYRWTAWEKVSLDIHSDHLIPVIWNRRLHLFWPIFTEKAKDTAPKKQTAESQSATPPEKYWEIQMAWSEYKGKKWLPKKVTTGYVQSTQHPQRSDVNDLKAYRLKHVFHAVPSGADLFIRVDHYGLPIPAYGAAAPTVLHPYEMFPVARPGLRAGSFHFTGCESDALTGDVEASGVIHLTGTEPEGMMLVEQSDRALNLPKSDTLAAKDTALEKTPGPVGFRLLYPHQDFGVSGNSPLFFQDATKTYFVFPEIVDIPVWKLIRATANLRPETIDLVRAKYYAKPAVALAIGPAKRLSLDPPVFEATFPVRTNITALALTPAKSAVAVANTAVTAGSVATKPVLPAYSKAISSFLNDSLIAPVSVLPTSRKEKKYRFQTFYHPYLCDLIRELNSHGIDGLLQRSLQTDSHHEYFQEYGPTSLINQPYPLEDIDFSSDGAYSQYNWELFFHVPMMIATRLSQNQRFEEAQQWFHYIFDPTDTSALDVPQKYWRTRPFYETAQAKYLQERIDRLLKLLAEDDTDPELEHQVQEWRDHPFSPHVIARLRTTAYQKNVVMKYLDNLIAWADQLFRRDTIESINEAAQIYILAAEILGRRPLSIPPRAVPSVYTYNSLQPHLFDLSNKLVGVERLVPKPSAKLMATSSEKPPITLPTTLYFCVMQNDKLLGYWDLVADRLFKIRHCMNIEGVVRQLPLFEPPIDPAMLVRAMAAGIDISSALNDMNAALPHYRFNVMAQKASELCAEVKAFGAALLAALEKKDAEALALLRSGHEISLLNKVREVKLKQIEEATSTKESLDKAKLVTEAKRDYYRDIKKTTTWEDVSLVLSAASLISQSAGLAMDIVAGASHLVPDFNAGVSGAFGSPHATVKYGGVNIGNSATSWADVAKGLAAILSASAAMSATVAGYERRWEDWKQQEKLANLELDQIVLQISAADFRRQISDQELINHDHQMDNANEADSFMRDKYTNRELYHWMIGQVSSLYFQAYQLAYDVAKRAEQSYRFELGIDDSNFIQFGYWDSLKKGLLAGERLHQDLKRMEVAYLDLNRREYEVTKHVSLLMYDPLKLVALKESGQCVVDLTEGLFDLDYPGHYMRRIKSVSMTIPCVTGPYTSVNCTLTLVRSSIRKTNVLRAGRYERDPENEDVRFRDSIGAIQSIATSSAQNDSGMFELNFRDERYLPFEGSGVISTWQIKLPPESNQFELGTVSDVILHVKYTAREGGQALGEKALAALPPGGRRLFSLKHEFPSEWHRFLNSPDATSGDHIQQFQFTQDRFPFYLQKKNIKILKTHVFVTSKGATPDPFDVYVTPNGSTPNDAADTVSLQTDPTLSGILHNQKSYPAAQAKAPGEGWKLKIKQADFDTIAAVLDDIALLFEFSAG
jgi:hypothetical protein